NGQHLRWRRQTLGDHKERHLAGKRIEEGRWDRLDRQGNRYGEHLVPDLRLSHDFSRVGAPGKIYGGIDAYSDGPRSIGAAASVGGWIDGEPVAAGGVDGDRIEGEV